MTVLDQLDSVRQIRRLGSLVQRVQETGFPDEQPLSVYLGGDIVPRSERSDNHNQLGGDLGKYQRVLIGDLVFNRLRTWQGGFGSSVYSGLVSPAYIVARPIYGHARYLSYVLHSAPYLAELTRISKWMPPSQFDVLWSDLREVPVPWVDLEEQRRIADFLDNRVSRIDRIITARREQLELVSTFETTLLQEVFDKCATGFGTTRLGHLLRKLEQGWSPQAEAQAAPLNEWGVMRSGCVNGGKFRAEDNKRLPAHLEPRTAYEIRGGDLLMSRASGSLDLIGSVAVVPDDVRRGLLLCDKIFRLTPSPGWSNQFLAPMLRSQGNRDRIRLGVSGAEGMANNLPSGIIRELRVPVAPASGQADVVEQTTLLAQQAEGMRSTMNHSIELLTEYKSSLITAAVTGELDVTTAGSNIPG